jgi:hypothetical protein
MIMSLWAVCFTFVCMHMQVSGVFGCACACHSSVFCALQACPPIGAYTALCALPGASRWQQLDCGQALMVACNPILGTPKLDINGWPVPSLTCAWTPRGGDVSLWPKALLNLVWSLLFSMMDW